MKRLSSGALGFLFGLGVGGTLASVAWGRGAAWFELAVLLLLAAGWLGTALALRRRLEDLVASQGENLVRLGKRVEALAATLRPAAPEAAPGKARSVVCPEVGAEDVRREPLRELEPVIAGAEGLNPWASGGWEEPVPAPAEAAREPAATEDEHAAGSWEEPPAARPLAPGGQKRPLLEALVAVWQAYLEEGSGHFSPAGLKRHLEEAGLSARVVAPGEIAAGPDVVAVEVPEERTLYVLPSFNATVRAVEEWFQTVEPRSLTARIQRLLRPAVAERNLEGLRLIERGRIE